MKRGVISTMVALLLALQGLVAPYNALAAQISDCTTQVDCPCCTDCCPGAGCDCMTPLFSGTVLALTGGGLQVFFASLTGGRTEFQPAPIASQTYVPLHPPPIR